MPKEEERKNGAEEIFEVTIFENFPKFMTDTKPQTQLREYQVK